MEQLRAPFTFQEIAEKPGRFSGVASVFGQEFPTEFGPTVIEPGAFSASLKARPQIPLLWQHDETEPIGLIDAMQETEEGLAVNGMLSETSRGKDARTLLKDRVIRDLSIGFDKREEQKSTPRRLKVVDLFEVSLVTWGAAGPLGARVRELNRASLTTAKASFQMADVLLRMTERNGYGEIATLPVAEIEKLCPACAQKLRAMGVTRIKQSAFVRALERLQMNEGMCQRVGGGDQGFFTRCTEMDWEGVDDTNAFCAALHTFCVGKPPGAE